MSFNISPLIKMCLYYVYVNALRENKCPVCDIPFTNTRLLRAHYNRLRKDEMHVLVYCTLFSRVFRRYLEPNCFKEVEDHVKLAYLASLYEGFDNSF